MARFVLILILFQLIIINLSINSKQKQSKDYITNRVIAHNAQERQKVSPTNSIQSLLTIVLYRNSTEKVHVVEEVQEKEVISLQELKSINTLLAASARKYKLQTVGELYLTLQEWCHEQSN